jgi:hypothetical protein
MNTPNREAWLQSLVALLRAHFETAGIALPVNVHTSVGWPSKNPRKVMGQCWQAQTSKDGAPQIFISPVIEQAYDVAGTLVHELLHASGITGHGPDFKKAMKKVGLEGKPRSTSVGDDLGDILRGLLKTLPPYPHAVIDMGVQGARKQTTRMLLLQTSHPEPTMEDPAAVCTYSVRTTAKHIKAGLPMCPHGHTLEPEEKVEEGA